MKRKINSRACYDIHDIERLTGIKADKIKNWIDDGTYKGFTICGTYMMTGKYIKTMVALENMKGK